MTTPNPVPINYTAWITLQEEPNPIVAISGERQADVQQVIDLLSHTGAVTWHMPDLMVAEIKPRGGKFLEN
ncbi:MAG: hypothetical protein AAGA46_03365 [Cyanobacteria bacterium P01_F01_bin.13]